MSFWIPGGRVQCVLYSAFLTSSDFSLSLSPKPCPCSWVGLSLETPHVWVGCVWKWKGGHRPHYWLECVNVVFMMPVGTGGGKRDEPTEENPISQIGFGCTLRVIQGKVARLFWAGNWFSLELSPSSLLCLPCRIFIYFTLHLLSQASPHHGNSDPTQPQRFWTIAVGEPFSPLSMQFWLPV